MTPEKEYRIKSTGLGHAHYGNCERCGKYCVTHYMQQWREVDRKSPGWHTAGFGHVACLRNGSWAAAPVLETT